MIEKNGGEVVFESNDFQGIDLGHVSIIISESIDFLKYSTVLTYHSIPVVRRAWVAAYLRNPLEKFRAYSPHPAYFFTGLTVHCSGFSIQDCEMIYGGVEAAGGKWTLDITPETTHIVAMEDSLPQQFENIVSKECKIVRPEWVEDCLKLRCKLDEASYYAFEQPGDLEVPSTPIGKTTRNLFTHFSYNSLPRVKSRLFEGKSFYLGQELSDVQNPVRLITEAGGSITRDLNQASVYVGNIRGGTEYISASQQQIWVGTPIWVYWMLEYDTWISPLRHVLHYPIPQTNVPGMENLNITISNYNGESRHYLKNLVELSGSALELGLTVRTTLLVVPDLNSIKAKRAREWGINIVNHLWLEETFALGKIQAVTNPRYIHFPEAADLGSIVGNTLLDPLVLKDYYTQIEGMPRPRSSQRSLIETSFVESVPKGSESPIWKAAAPRLLYKRVLDDLPETPVHKQRKIVREVSNVSWRPESRSRAMYVIQTGLKSKLPYPQVQQLQRLGIYLTDDPKKATHIVAHNICRTQKFLVALSNAPTILSETYLTSCCAANERLPTSDFLLHDKDNERKFGRSIPEILERARGFKGSLLQGYTFGVTPGLRDTFETFANVIAAHGGTAIKVDSPVDLDRCTPSADGKTYLITTNKQRAILSQFKKLFRADAFAYPADCLLVSILKMEVSFNPTLAL